MVTSIGIIFATPGMVNVPFVLKCRIESVFSASDQIVVCQSSYWIDGKLSAFIAAYISSFIALFPHSIFLTDTETRTSQFAVSGVGPSCFDAESTAKVAAPSRWSASQL